MIDRWYMIVAAADLGEWLARADCVTKVARVSVDRAQAVVKLSAQVEGSLTHSQALELMGTDDWQVGDE